MATPLVVLVIIDALGADLVAQHELLPELPVRRRLRTVLGYSSAAIPSLLSGVTPGEHGHWSMYARARSADADAAFRGLGTPLRAASRLPRGREFVRRRTAAYVKQSGRVRGYFSLYEVPLELLPYFDLVEKNDLFAPGGLEHTPTLFDRLHTAGVAHAVWSWRDDPREASDACVARVADDAARVLVLYRADLDAAMHAHGVQSPQAVAVMRDVERTVRAILEAARAAGRPVQLALTSDHGMADALTLHDLPAHVAALGLRVPDDYLPFYDSTMGRFWFHTDAARTRIVAALDAFGAGTRLDAADLARHGCTFADARYGDCVYLMPVGHQIAPSFMGTHAPIAMHGYSPDDSVMDACFVTTGFGDDAASILDVLPRVWAEVEHAAR